MPRPLREDPHMITGDKQRRGLLDRRSIGLPPVHGERRELLADPSVDVVYVATRHDLHYPIARAAVRAA